MTKKFGIPSYGDVNYGSSTRVSGNRKASAPRLYVISGEAGSPAGLPEVWVRTCQLFACRSLWHLIFMAGPSTHSSAQLSLKARPERRPVLKQTFWIVFTVLAVGTCSAQARVVCLWFSGRPHARFTFRLPPVKSYLRLFYHPQVGVWAGVLSSDWSLFLNPLS